MKVESLRARIEAETQSSRPGNSITITYMPFTHEELPSSTTNEQGQWHHEATASRKRLLVTEHFKPNKQNRRFRRT